MRPVAFLPAGLARLSRACSLAVVAVLAIALLPMLPAQPVSAASGQITVENYVCPDGYNPEGDVFGDIAAACTTPVAGETFTLAPDGGAPANANTDASGIASWPSSDPGSGTITQVDPGVYESSVWCSVFEEGAFGTIGAVPAAGGSISYSIPDGQLMDCYWFNYAFVIVVPGSEIRLQKWVCPDDYDAEAAATIDELWAGCTQPGADFPFARVPDGGDPPVELQADASGEIIWPEFPAGTGSITETAAENNLSRVFCTGYEVGEIGLATYVEVDATGNQIFYDLASGEGLGCQWFDYTPPGEFSDIIIIKRACPEGDWTDADLPALSLECVDPHPDVTFQIFNPSFDFQSTTDASGTAAAAVPSGDTYGISESTPEGYGAARVFCSYYDQNVGPGEYPEVDAPGNTIEVTLEPGFSLECYWFDLPAQLGRFEIAKYECPAGYGVGTGYDALSASCTVPVGGVTFTLTPAEGDPVQGDTAADGTLVFDNVPLGEGTLGESVPAGYNWVEVYCSIADDVAEGPYQGQNITAQNVMGYLMEPSQAWRCSWFNLTLEAGPASLTINKFTCQSAHDPIDPNQTLINECAEPTEDILFSLEGTFEGASGPLSASTGTGGAPATIRFTELEPGTYRLTEEIPDSVRLAYIGACRSDVRSFEYPFSPFAVIEPDGRVNIELLPGEDLECDWYNILAEQLGTVAIIKSWCQGEVVDAQNCELYSGGIAFTLVSQDGGEDISLTTGEDGTATTDAEGTYEVVEDDFEWCAAQSDAADAEGNIVVGPGAEVTVEIFNCGPMPLQETS
jgi:hypothetical protein